MIAVRRVSEVMKRVLGRWCNMVTGWRNVMWIIYNIQFGVEKGNSELNNYGFSGALIADFQATPNHKLDTGGRAVWPGAGVVWWGRWRTDIPAWRKLVVTPVIAAPLPPAHRQHLSLALMHTPSLQLVCGKWDREMLVGRGLFGEAGLWRWCYMCSLGMWFMILRG